MIVVDRSLVELVFVRWLDMVFALRLYSALIGSWSFGLAQDHGLVVPEV